MRMNRLTAWQNQSESMTGNLKIVLAGCGGISDLWLKALSGISDVSVVGLVDLQEAVAASKKSLYLLDQARTGTDLREMLRSVQPDLVFDCTIPDARASVVLTALEHGCHVLSEKPMAANMTEAHQLLEASAKADRLFAVMQNRRYNHRIRAFRDFLATGVVGDLTTWPSTVSTRRG
jgi:predicted dehydrogenase